MKNKKIKPTRSRFNVLRQICNLIPGHEVSKIARETGVEDMSRAFSPWSHTVSLLDAQLTHCIGLNDLCDSLQLHSGPLSTIRGATPPSRNEDGVSPGYWKVPEHFLAPHLLMAGTEPWPKDPQKSRLHAAAMFLVFDYQTIVVLGVENIDSSI